MIFQKGAAEDNTEVVEKLSKKKHQKGANNIRVWGSKCENIP